MPIAIATPLSPFKKPFKNTLLRRRKIYNINTFNQTWTRIIKKIFLTGRFVAFLVACYYLKVQNAVKEMVTCDQKL
jgi:hypothetical protein